MSDITMCKGESENCVCKLRDKCYRYTAETSRYQSWFAELPIKNEYEKCTYYWPNQAEGIL